MENQDKNVLFVIKDLGRGNPDEQLNKIFKGFKQVSATDSRQKEFMGMGLAICSQIVEQHNGQIWAESSLGEGSSFFLYYSVSRIGERGK